MINVPMEDVEGLLKAIEDFFGPDIFAPMTTTEERTAALNKFGGNLKRLVETKRNNEKAAREIYDAADNLLEDGEFQDFLEEEINNSSDREDYSVDKSTQEMQILFLVETLGEVEVRRLLSETFEISI